MCPLIMWTTKRADPKRTMDIWTAARGSVGDFSALEFNPKWGLGGFAALDTPNTECRFWVKSGPFLTIAADTQLPPDQLGQLAGRAIVFGV
jgi:hypothetical protein